MITIKIKRMQGECFDLQVDPSWSVARLKDELCTRIGGGMTPDRLRLISSGRVLKNEAQSLSDLRDGQALHVVEKTNDDAAPTSQSSSPPPQAQPQPNVQQMPRQNVMFGPTSQGPDLGGLLTGLIGGAMRDFQQAARPPSAPQTQPQPQPQPQPAQTTTSPAREQSGRPQAPSAGEGVQAQQAAAPATAPATIVQGVHIVIHATPADLETLPQRISAFQREVEANARAGGLPVHIAGSTPTPAPGQPEQQRAAPQPGIEAALGSIGQGLGGILQNVAPAVLQVAQHVATSSASQVPLQHPQQQARAQAPAPQAAETAATAATSTRSMVDTILAEVKPVLGMPEMMMIAGGNTTPIDKVEPIAARHLHSALGEDTKESRERLATDGAEALLAEWRGNEQAMAHLTARSDNPEMVFSDTQKMVAPFMLRLMSVVLDVPTRQGQPFHACLCAEVKRFVGHWMERVRMRFPQDQVAGVTKFLELVTVKHLPGDVPVPLVLPMAIGWVQRSHQEYLRTRPADRSDDLAYGLTPAPAGEFDTLSGDEVALLNTLAARTPGPVPQGPLSDTYNSGS